MPRFEVAHIHQPGQDMVIVLLERAFGRAPDREQQGIILELQARSRAAGMRGTVVPVWDEGGRLGSIPPQPWRLFFESITPQWLAANLNKQLYW